MRHHVVRDCVCASESYLRQSSQGQIKSLPVLTPGCPLLSPLKQTSILQILCIFEFEISFLPGQISNISIVSILMSMFMNIESPSCLFMCKMRVDLIRDFGMEVIDISLWDGHIDLVISLQPQLSWLG